MPYQVQEFKEWLVANPDQQFTEREGILSVWNQGNLNKVLRKIYKIDESSPVVQALKKWLITKDNNSPTRETALNRWQVLHSQITTDKNNWQRKLTDWEKKEKTKKEISTQVRDIVDSIITNLQNFSPSHPKKEFVAANNRFIIYNGKTILNIDSLNDMKQKLESLITN